MFWSFLFRIESHRNKITYRIYISIERSYSYDYLWKIVIFWTIEVQPEIRIVLYFIHFVVINDSTWSHYLLGLRDKHKTTWIMFSKLIGIISIIIKTLPDAFVHLPRFHENDLQTWNLPNNNLYMSPEVQVDLAPIRHGLPSWLVETHRANQIAQIELTSCGFQQAW